MKIILMSGEKKDYDKSIVNISSFIKSTYNVKYIYASKNKGSIYTLETLYQILDDPDINITHTSNLNINYKNADKITDITDVDLWDRTDKYHATVKKMRSDTDEDISKRLRSIYGNITSQHLNTDNYDVVIIADKLIIASFVEELYRINRYFTYRNIGCFISVINTKNNLLDLHRFYIL